jgi:hypothetical protein
MATVAFDEDQLDCMSAVNIPRTIERVLQEPTHKTIGPFRVGDANVRTVTVT